MDFAEVVLEDSGENLDFETDETIFHKGNVAIKYGIIISGHVNMVTSYGIFMFRAGDCIGLTDCFSGSYLNDFIADGETTIRVQSFSGKESLGRFLSIESKHIRPLLNSYNAFSDTILKVYNVLLDLSSSSYQKLKISYDRYKTFIVNRENASNYTSRDIERIKAEYKYGLPSDYHFDYMKELKVLINDESQLIDLSPQITSILIERQSQIILELLVNCDNMYSFLLRICALMYGKGEKSLYALVYTLTEFAFDEDQPISIYLGELKNLLDFATDFETTWLQNINSQFPIDTKRLEKMYQIFKESSDSNNNSIYTDNINPKQEMFESFNNLLSKLFEYADYDEAAKESFIKCYKDYMALVANKFNSDHARNIIKNMENEYYNLYSEVFLKTEQQGNIPLFAELFMDYGILDDKLFDETDILPLLQKIEKGIYSEVYNVYTMSQWLHLIYSGKKEPSLNELGYDYLDLLKELKKSKNLSKEDEANYLKDQKGKVLFEIKQMFRLNNRQIFASNGNFCPFIRGDEFGSDISKQVINGQDLEAALSKIRCIDYRAFYKEERVQIVAGQTKENMTLLKEVLPDIIIIPNIGERACMWQDYANHNRLNPGRFTFPMFPFGNLEEMLYPVMAKYRYEYARTDAGMRWNDISDHNFTAEYYNYIQFYKKNSLLSESNKQKIKEKLAAHKSVENIFETDYISWLKYESMGAFRLNKVSRDIMTKYAPFSKEIRIKLKDNPMFKESFATYEVLHEREIHLFDLKLKTIEKNGGEITDELKRHRQLIDQ